MRADLLAEINGESHARQAFVLITNLKTGAQRLVRDSGVADDPLAPQLTAQLRLGNSSLIETPDGTEIFLRVLTPKLRLMVIGAVHVAQALIPLAQLTGFEVTVVDPRTAFASPERFPDCSVIAEWPQRVFAEQSLDRYTAMAVLSHIPNIDDDGIKAAIAGRCYYIGALGSRKTHAKRLGRLRGENIPETALTRIRAPIGLDIGAVSVTEIAISIIAEVIAARRQEPLWSEQEA